MAHLDVGVVLLAFLEGDVDGVADGHRGEVLDPLDGEIAVGHRLANHDRIVAPVDEEVGELACGLGLPTARSDRVDRHDGYVRVELPIGTDQPKVGACGEHPGGLVLAVLVSDVGGGGEDDLVESISSIRISRSASGRMGIPSG